MPLGRYRGYFKQFWGFFFALTSFAGGQQHHLQLRNQGLYLSTSIWLFLNSVLQEHLAASPSMYIFRYFPISNYSSPCLDPSCLSSSCNKAAFVSGMLLAVFLRQPCVKHPQTLRDRDVHYPLLQTLVRGRARVEVHYILSLSPLADRQPEARRARTLLWLVRKKLGL